MISTELNRIIAVKPVLKEIIEHNGGSVPEGALISQYADSIMAIKKQTGFINNGYSFLTFECVGLMSNQTQAWIALEKIGSPTILKMSYLLNGVSYDYTLDTKIYLRIGDRVSFAANVVGRSLSAYIHFYGGNGYFNAYGDVSSMDDFKSTPSSYAYANLFALVDNKVLPLLKAPDFSKIKKHSQYMFYQTFYNNTYLLDGPELDFMNGNYTLLTPAPVSCCESMCNGCVNLRYIKIMCGASNTLGTNFFQDMISNTNGSGRLFYNSSSPTPPSGWVRQRGTLFD